MYLLVAYKANDTDFSRQSHFDSEFAIAKVENDEDFVESLANVLQRELSQDTFDNSEWKISIFQALFGEFRCVWDNEKGINEIPALVQKAKDLAQERYLALQDQAQKEWAKAQQREKELDRVRRWQQYEMLKREFDPQ